MEMGLSVTMIISLSSSFVHPFLFFSLPFFSHLLLSPQYSTPLYFLASFSSSPSTTFLLSFIPVQFIKSIHSLTLALTTFQFPPFNTPLLNMTTEKSKVTASKTVAVAEDGTGVIALDPWLSPYKTALQERYSISTLSSLLRCFDAVVTYPQDRTFTF